MLRQHLTAPSPLNRPGHTALDGVATAGRNSGMALLCPRVLNAVVILFLATALLLQSWYHRSPGGYCAPPAAAHAVAANATVACPPATAGAGAAHGGAAAIALADVRSSNASAAAAECPKCEAECPKCEAAAVAVATPPAAAPEPRVCSITAASYVMGDLERVWSENITVWQESYCPHQLAFANKTQVLVDTLRQLNGAGAGYVDVDPEYAYVSKLVLTEQCGTPSALAAAGIGAPAITSAVAAGATKGVVPGRALRSVGSSAGTSGTSESAAGVNIFAEPIEPLYALLRDPMSWQCPEDVPIWERPGVAPVGVGPESRRTRRALAGAATEGANKVEEEDDVEDGPFDVSLPDSEAAGTSRAWRRRHSRRLALAPAGGRLMDVEHIILAHISFPRVRDAPQKIYFDLGASHWEELSQQWMIKSYASRGIHFNRIIMWESRMKQGAELVDKVPPQFYHAWQFFNVPATSTPGDGRNPLEILRKIARPEDFVAFKLDIDNWGVENEFIHQIMSDKELYSRIDEFFFEKHFNYAGMVRCCWQSTIDPGAKLVDVYKLFTQLRQLGIRAHGWP